MTLKSIKHEIFRPHLITCIMYISSVIVALVTIPIIITYVVRSNNFVFTQEPPDVQSCFVYYTTTQYLGHKVECTLDIDPLPIPNLPMCINLKHNIPTNNVTACFANEGDCCRHGFDCDKTNTTYQTTDVCYADTNGRLHTYDSKLFQSFTHSCVCKDTVTDNLCTIVATSYTTFVLNIVETSSEKTYTVYENSPSLHTNETYQCNIQGAIVNIENNYYECKIDNEHKQVEKYELNIIISGAFLGSWLGLLIIIVIICALCCIPTMYSEIN